MYNCPMPLLRKIVFYLFVLAYLLIAPVILLRLLGSVVDIKHHKIIKTGLIYTTTIPSGATITIDNKKVHQKTPTVIRDLLPGEYAVSLNKSGFNPVHSTVDIKDEQASLLENIFLSPTIWPIEPLTRNFHFDDFIAISGSHTLIARQGNQDFVLRLPKNDPTIESIFNAPQSLFAQASIYKDGTIRKLYTIEQSPIAIAQILTNQTNKFFVIEPQDKEIYIEDISDLITTSPDQILWEYNDNKNIYILSQGVLNRLNIKEKSIYPRILDHVAAVDIHDNALWVLTENNSIIRSDAEGKSIKTIVSHLPEINTNDQPHIYMLTEKTFFISSTKGLIYVSDSVKIISSEKIDGLQFNEDKNKTLVWSGNNLGIINNISSQQEPIHITWTYQASSRINQAWWINNDHSIIVANNHQIALTDATPLNPIRNILITPLGDSNRIFYHEKTGRLYFIDPANGLLSFIDFNHLRNL